MRDSPFICKNNNNNQPGFVSSTPCAAIRNFDMLAPRTAMLALRCFLVMCDKTQAS
eukprot:m.204873 g.204873  ORF g.204873 m.204873 type:complete len:56 (+) comp15780_c0_seq17:1543-1710(+)